MDRVQKAGDNHVERVAALEEYLTLTRAHEGETWFDAGAWTEDLALGARVPGQAPCGSRLAPTTPTTSGSMYRLASGTATSATTPKPGMPDHRAGASVAHR
jgi:hypothetical protein